MARHSDTRLPELGSFQRVFQCMSTSNPGVVIAEDDGPSAARAFIAEHERRSGRWNATAALAWWNANVSGRDQDFKAKEDAQNRLDAALSDPCPLRPSSRRSRPAESAIRSWRGRSTCSTCSTWRSRSIPSCSKQITAKANVIEKAFNGYRASVNGREMTDSEVRQVLKESRDSDRAQGRLGRKQGGRSARRGRLEGTGQAPKRGRAQARLCRLSQAPASSQRAVARASPQAFRRARRADARAVPQAQERDRRQAGRTERRVDRRAASLALP